MAATTGTATELGIWAEWSVEVELDPNLLCEAVLWVFQRLMYECQQEDVPPVGELTIVTKPSMSDYANPTIRRAVNLQIDPLATWDWAPPKPWWRRWAPWG